MATANQISYIQRSIKTEGSIRLRPERAQRLLIAAPNRMGRAFVKQLMKRKIAFALMTNNHKEQEKLSRLQQDHLLMLNTGDPETWTAPAFEVGAVIIFENSLTLTWRYVNYCRQWTDNPIHLVAPRISSIAKRRELNVIAHPESRACGEDRAAAFITDIMASVRGTAGDQVL